MASTPNDPNYPLQWGLNNASDVDIDAPEAWDHQTGSGVLVGVVDVGADTTHEDFAGRISSLSRNVIEGRDPADLRDQTEHSHGTTVAGIIGAAGNNAKAITGVAQNVQLVIVKAGNQTMNEAAVIQAIDYLTLNQVKVSNHSYSPPQETSPNVKDAIVRAAASNHLLIFAAGNGGLDAVADNNDTQEQCCETPEQRQRLGESTIQPNYACKCSSLPPVFRIQQIGLS